MKIACLFDGAGLARLGLEQAGHKVTGFELDPWKHHLSTFVGSGNCILADVTKVDIRSFDAVWASPPCQLRSSARTQGPPVSQFAKDYLKWCLSLGSPILWVENIVSQSKSENGWGKKWNFAMLDPQEPPRQSRNRIVGGRYVDPKTYRPFKRWYGDYPGGICPTIVATEFKGCGSDKRRASRFYGRRLTVQECAYHQGLEIPEEWLIIPDGFSRTRWERQLYEAIGNGVPVWASKAFGEAYPR
jgi:site-specific DNA-cytosine methylase